MMATVPTAPSLNWAYCPEEILRMIFQKLTMKSLVSCLTVNRRWNDIALHFIEFNSLWTKMFSEAMANKGITYQMKSVLGFQEMMINSLLWPFIHQAKLELHHTYTMEDLIAIHVYKDNVILLGRISLTPLPKGVKVKYYNITSKKKMRTFVYSGDAIDYVENDYMVVQFGEDFRAYGKKASDDACINKDLDYFMDDVNSFRLVDNICYLVTHRNVIYALKWNRRNWEIKARGRYYGNPSDRICGINVFKGRICMATKFGYVVHENLESRSFHKLNSYNYAARLQESSVLVLFNEKDVAMAVNNRRVEVSEDFKSTFISFKSRDMTCATEHGEIIFIGYADGAVGIRTIDNMPDGEPDRVLRVQDFDNTIEDPRILGLEVFEDKMSHHLFVATRHKILELLITYPDEVKHYFT